MPSSITVLIFPMGIPNNSPTTNETVTNETNVFSFNLTIRKTRIATPSAIIKIGIQITLIFCDYFHFYFQKKISHSHYSFIFNLDYIDNFILTMSFSILQ